MKLIKVNRMGTTTVRDWLCTYWYN